MNIQIYNGTDGVKKAYEESLVSARLDIVCFANQYSRVIGDYFDKEYSPKLFSSKIITREILPDTQENRAYAKTKDVKKNQVKFLKLREASESDMIIADDRAILVSYSAKEPFAVVITDTEIISHFRNMFTELWGKI